MYAALQDRRGVCWVEDRLRYAFFLIRYPVRPHDLDFVVYAETSALHVRNGIPARLIAICGVPVASYPFRERHIYG
jgi:hypothetical protein